jgi:hypothetical protein
MPLVENEVYAYGIDHSGWSNVLAPFDEEDARVAETFVRLPANHRSTIGV